MGEVCDAPSCASRGAAPVCSFLRSGRSTLYRQRLGGAKQAFDGVPAECRRPLDALLGCAEHHRGHTEQRRADVLNRIFFVREAGFTSYCVAKRGSPHTVWRATRVGGII